MAHTDLTRLAAPLALVVAMTGCARGAEPVRPTTTEQVSARLVYATDTGVYVLPRDGAPRLLARADSVRDLALSTLGRYAAWVSDGGSGFAFHVADVVDGTARSAWTSPDVDAAAVEAARDGFVAVDVGETSRLVRFDPGSILRGGAPELTLLRGVRHAHLLAAAGDRVLVARSEAADRGEAVYDVAADGSAKRLFVDDAPLPKGDFHRLPIRAAALSPDGRTLVYGTGIRGNGLHDECHLGYGAEVRDLATGRLVPTAPVPTLGEDVFTLVHSVTTGADGRTVIGFSTEMESCGGQPLRGAAYAVDAGRWTLVARGAAWAATGPDGSLATISADGALTVGGRRIASGVRLASWSRA